METRQKVLQNSGILYRTVQRAKLQGELELTDTPSVSSPATSAR